MVNKSRNKNQIQKRRTNPLSVIHRLPRNKLAFDGTTLNSVYYAALTVTAANAADNSFTIDCASTTSVASPLSSITSQYNEYVFNSVHVDFIPSVAPGVADGGSQIYMAYLDNVEKYATWTGLATSALKITAMRQMKSFKAFNAWERITYRVPLTRRRKTFDVNATPTSTTDSWDRSTQGFFLIAQQSISAVATLGTVTFRTSVNLMGLDPGLAT